jgi:hypothetical protein
MDFTTSPKYGVIFEIFCFKCEHILLKALATESIAICDKKFKIGFGKNIDDGVF